MGLCISAGELFGDLIENDEEGAQWLREHFAIVNAVLVKNGLPPHREPEETLLDLSRAECPSFPYSFLHHLRRAAAYHLERQSRLESQQPGAGARPSFWVRFLHVMIGYEPPASDPLLPDVISPVPSGVEVTNDSFVEKWSSTQHHLLYHSDCEGMYVPIDFPEVIVDAELPGTTLGSSHRLLHELIGMAPVLGIELANGELSDAEAARINHAVCVKQVGLYRESMVWLALYEAARLSVRHNVAIIFH